MCAASPAHNPSWFDGLLARPVASLVFAVAQEQADLESLGHAIKHAPFAVTGTADEQSAQVHRGGIPFDIVNLATLGIDPPQSPQLFACGEALDMDADCGGFNLAWAWLSASVPAGQRRVQPRDSITRKVIMIEITNIKASLKQGSTEESCLKACKREATRPP